MHTVHRTPALAVTATATRDLDADLIILPVFEDDDFADEAGLNDACGGEIERARQRGELTGKACELFLTIAPQSGSAPRRFALVGAGARSRVTADTIRRLATVGGLAARHRKLGSVAIA